MSIGHENPNLVLILSGKRKSGKDFVYPKIAQELHKIQPGRLMVRQLVLSSQLKKIYANQHNLDFEKLLDSSSYKENYRLDMIK